MSPLNICRLVIIFLHRSYLFNDLNKMINDLNIMFNDLNIMHNPNPHKK